MTRRKSFKNRCESLARNTKLELLRTQLPKRSKRMHYRLTGSSSQQHVEFLSIKLKHIKEYFRGIKLLPILK